MVAHKSQNTWTLMSLLAAICLMLAVISLGGQTPCKKLGLAAKYAGDEGIEKDPNVILFTDFESDKWHKHWSGGKSVVPTSSSAKRLPKSNLTVQKVRWGSVALHLYCEASHALAESPGSVKFSFAHAWIERSRNGGCTRLSPDAAGYFVSIERSRHYHPVVQHK